MNESKDGQHVVTPGVGPIARLKQENRDLTLEVKRLTHNEKIWKQKFYDEEDDRKKVTDQCARLRELQSAAEDIDGPKDWFHKDIRPAISRLHKAIRKVRGMT